MQSDYDTMTAMLAKGYNDTEEKLLNEVFGGRWNQLSIAYNCQKRSFKLAPQIWNTHRQDGTIKIIHYVGGKPWQTSEELLRLDWEGTPEEMAVYVPLFDVWHCIRKGTAQAENGSLMEYVPYAPIP
jgi:lipopolysaccharide biosynthesis glycosyltransferase